MASFQKIVFFIAIILLIIALISIAISLQNSKSNAEWPPLVGDCPDYWVDISGNGAMCINSHSLGTCNLPTTENKNPKDFTENLFMGSNGTCAKYLWAKNCGVTWDGITSGISNPCNSETTETT